jgi:hypothetical protein
MRVTPKNEEELSRFQNLPPGKYPFTVLESDEVPSKSSKNAGKLMFKLKLNVHGPDFDKHVYDYFADWFSEWKLKHFCDTSGLADNYAAGAVDGARNGFEGRTGFVLIEIEDNPTYGEKNVVTDYFSEEAAQSKKPKSAEPSPIDNNDDVPF